ncbi:hypothetical protein niasHT_034491 [Heterodera trifolii]|uniref:Gustatory receptor n=1 Tax=Heterodera trifolii TaxID=157864 RepID=A0ABD2HRK8_9BILA
MALSTVRWIMQLTKWVTFCFGVLMNGIMIRLIVRHTPKSMRNYSNILLQTCFTDLALLTMTLLFQKYTFTTAKGENEVLLDGLVTFDGPEHQNWCLLGAIAWIFLVYVSLFGYVSQFIYRYMLLNWDKKISLCAYFLLFLAILIFPLVYCVNLFFCYFMPAGSSRFLDDQSTADILGLNISDRVPLTGYTFKKQAKNMSTSSIAIKMIEMNKQISRNLVVQASMPLFIYLSIVFLLCLILLKIDTYKVNWLQYFNLLSIIPMFLPSALNPIVTICVIKNYQIILVNDIKKIVKRFKLLFARQSAESPVEKWAVLTKHSIHLKTIA